MGRPRLWIRCESTPINYLDIELNWNAFVGRLGECDMNDDIAARRTLTDDQPCFSWCNRITST